MDAEPRDVETLCARTSAGLQPDYVFFWGHTGAPSGIGKECLSQWYPAPFVLDGITYATAEHYMMAEKARLFGDQDAERAIVAASHPSEAKNLGRTVRSFDSATWNAQRVAIVTAGNVAKFGQNPPLRDFLVSTGQSVLVEASPTDAVWGIGLAADDPRAKEPSKWRGLNLLGFALMDVRERCTSVS